MGHFRFATTASDMGGLLIEDLAAVPDLAAASFNEVLARLGWPLRQIGRRGCYRSR